MWIILPILALVAVDATGSVPLRAQVADCHKRLIDAEEALAAERVVVPRWMRISTAQRALDNVKRECTDILLMHILQLSASLAAIAKRIKSEQDHVGAIHAVLVQTFEEFQVDIDRTRYMFRSFPCTQVIEPGAGAVLIEQYLKIWMDYDEERFRMDWEPTKVMWDIHDRRRVLDDKLRACRIHPSHRVDAARQAAGLIQVHLDEFALMATDNHRRYDTLKNSRDELLAERAVAQELERRMNS